MQNGISVPFFNPEGLTALLDGSPVFFLGVFLMQTYIITMDMENELSEAAASALNGHFFYLSTKLSGNLGSGIGLSVR